MDKLSQAAGRLKFSAIEYLMFSFSVVAHPVVCLLLHLCSSMLTTAYNVCPTLLCSLIANAFLLSPGFSSWVGKISRGRERLPTPVFWPGEFHGLYSPWGRKELDTTERLSHFDFTSPFSAHIHCHVMWSSAFGHSFSVLSAFFPPVSQSHYILWCHFVHFL